MEEVKFATLTTVTQIDTHFLRSYTFPVPAFVHRADVWVFTIILGLLFPLADHFFFSRLKTTLQVYLWNILSVWTLAAVAAWLVYRHGLSLSDFGQTFGTYPRTLIACAVLVVLVAALVLVNKLQKRKPSPEKMAELTAKVRKLLPVTRTERIAAIFLALSAGFGEEFLYRGWLLTVTGQALHSVWVGLIVSSILFGFAHLYQGRNGMLSTGCLGLVFGLIYIASASLLPGQILHAALDLQNLLSLGRIASHTSPTTRPNL
ncbi:MAG TPA: CPBP family intramembrane glutamic endopeptidase [Candidatus Eremiobacteraceae bacterium]|nr:CPBP family intramembrane glutamic endopeptidase [Candidatus Eremiobacteraceae bacterium]